MYILCIYFIYIYTHRYYKVKIRNSPMFYTEEASTHICTIDEEIPG